MNNNIFKKIFYIKLLASTYKVFLPLVFVALFFSFSLTADKNPDEFCVQSVKEHADILKSPLSKPSSQSMTPICESVKIPIRSTKTVHEDLLPTQQFGEIACTFDLPASLSAYFSIQQCSYHFLRLNILQSQAHPPTWIYL